MKRIRTIRGLLLSASIVFSIAMVTATYFVIAHLYDRSVRENSLRDAKIFARVTFNSMFQLMSTGWNRGQMEGFIAAIQKSVSDTEYQIDIYRGQKVDELFGAILQKAPDQAIQTALKTGESAENDSGSQVRYIYALKAQRVCIDCHVNAKEGETLGVIDVKHSVASAIDAHSRQIAGTILPLIPVALLATWFMVGYIRRRLDDSIDRLATDIRAVNRISDLSKLEQRPIDLGFAEFDRVSIEVRQLTERLRNVAVDKEMLEFEIRLLEKFILSSDVIRDWREYINRLLIEIDQVMPAYSLFSLFKIGDDALDLEVFWRYQPSKATTMAFEHAVRETLRKKRYFEGGLMLRIQHHVADVTREIPTLSEADIGPECVLNSKAFELKG